MSGGSEILAKIRNFLSWESNRKRRADENTVQGSQLLTKYRRITTPPNKNDHKDDIYKKCKFNNKTLKAIQQNDYLSTMGSTFSKIKRQNNTDHSMLQKQYNIDTIEFSDDDELMFVTVDKNPLSTSSPKNNQMENNHNKPVPGLMKPSFYKRIPRLPALNPINKPMVTKPVFYNGITTKANTNATNMTNGSTSFGKMNNIPCISQRVSLNKNVASYTKSPVLSRTVSSLNSIVPKQHDFNEKHNYEKLLKLILPGYGMDLSGDAERLFSRLPTQRKSILSSQRQKQPAEETIEISDEEIKPPRKRTETEIFEALRNSTDMNDDIYSPKLEKINTLKSKLEVNQEFQESWLTNLNQRYSGMKLQKTEAIKTEREKTEKIRAETRQHEKIYQHRMVKDWMISDVLVLDDYEPEQEIDDFSPFTDADKATIERAMKGQPNEVLVQKFNMTITRRDIHTLDWNHLNWLNDEVINFYMSLLIERGELRANDGYPKIYAMNTFFIPRLLQNGHSGVRRWTRKVDIFAHDIIPVPVHVGGVHWCMAIIHLKNKTIKYYDSMGSPNRQVLMALEDYLKAECLDKKNQTMDMSGWTAECVADIPRQQNGSDCGVFSCMFAEFICRNRPIIFSQQHMQYFRMKMVLEICSGKMMV